MRERKRYEKPVLSKVELRADEAVLAACKTMGDAGCQGVGDPPPKSAS
ncbi:hypothetical protein LLH03_03610 [bacterium]|nr:hypothetical protein [bacterium]